MEVEQDARVPTPDLMSEQRVRTEAARDADGVAEPVAQVPLSLLRRVAAALGEARIALAERRTTEDRDGRREWRNGNGFDSARRVALNMALNGASIAETELYLRRNFARSDSAQVAAEAYARVSESLLS